MTVRLLSVGLLNFDQAWTRARASANSSGIPDRLPFEVLTRLRNAGHAQAVGAFGSPYAPGSPVVVFAPKESRTLRPFVALPPTDHVLFQALVDQCIPKMIVQLPPADVVFQYRPVETGRSTFAAKPRWRDFTSHTQDVLARGYSHVLETDIAGFFLHIQPKRVVAGLLALGVSPDVCSDLETLLAHLELHGVQGLPQGQDASSALSNVALAPLDRLLTTQGIAYSRWSDDVRVFCKSFREARVVQERIERELFDGGFTLAAGKTTVRTAASAAKRLENLEESIERVRDDRIREALEESGPYDPDGLDMDLLNEEAEAAAIEEFYEEVIQPIRLGGWSKDPLFRTKMSFALRMLGQIGSGAATRDVADLAFRYPDQLESISNYLRRVADQQRGEVIAALSALHRRAAYAGEYQRLSVASASIALAPAGAETTLASLLAADALDTTANPILRRRAGLAAVALSARSDRAPADALWTAFDRMPDPPLSKLYLVVGASCLEPSARDALYALWTGESRLLSAAIALLQAGTTLDMSRV